METRNCYYCGKEVNILRMIDGVCRTNLECVLRLHRSYGNEEFIEECKRWNEDPADWEEYLSERDKEDKYWDDLRKLKLGDIASGRERDILMQLKGSDNDTIDIIHPDIPVAIARDDLIKSGLIEVVTNGYKYKLTSKGKDYVDRVLR